MSLGLLIAAASGCTGKNNAGGSAATAPLTEAERVLKKMIDAYAKADSYGDIGELRMEMRKDGKLEELQTPYTVVLERPGKLTLHLYRGTYTSDGTTAWAWDDDIRGYVVKRPASNPITLNDVNADPAIRDAVNGVVGMSLPAEMLLGTDAMALIMVGATDPPHLLSDDKIDDRACRRVRIKRGDGFSVYWIDRESSVLRRIEFPTQRLPQTLGAKEVRLTAEFVNAELNTPIPPEVFQFSPPPQIKIVEKLDPTWGRSPPQPPADVLGKKPGDFKLRVIDGPTLSRADLEGKVAVLLFVSLDDISAETLEAIDEVYKKYGRNESVRIYVVSIDRVGSDGSDDKEFQEFRKLSNLLAPLARVADESAQQQLQVQYVPNLFIIDRQGIVQDNEIGLNPKLKDELGARIEDALAGKSLVESSRTRYAERLRNYEAAQQTQAAISAGAPTSQKLAPKSQPKTLKLTQVWQNTEFKKPGHITVAEEKGKPTRVVVLDGLRAAGELDAAGKLVRTVDLNLPTAPTEAVVSFLRTGIDEDGKRYFVGSASAQQQLHVFDADLKKTLSFPQEGSHAGISDVQLADVDGDGRLEILVGYWGVVGVQAVAIDGFRRWSDRNLPENVQYLTVTGPDKEGRRLILCTTGLMTMAVIDEKGETLKLVPIAGRGARLIQAADLTNDGSVELCAITATNPGTDTAVGFNASGAELWNYPLPEGLQPVPEMQNEMVVGGKVLKDGTGLWVLAGADGTLHLLDAVGKPIDSFGWGAAIRGLAIGTLDDLPALFVSDEKSVTALRLER